MAREIFYTAVKYNEDGSTQHATGVTTQLGWPALKQSLARRKFHIKSWCLIDESPPCEPINDRDLSAQYTAACDFARRSPNRSRPPRRQESRNPDNRSSHPLWRDRVCAPARKS